MGRTRMGPGFVDAQSLKPNNNKSEAYEPSTEDTQTETYNPADYYEWEGQWYKWDEQERRQKCLTKNSTSPNKKGPVNTRVHNWMLAMRRNMKPEVKEAALRPFTITRERLHEVRSHSLECSEACYHRMCSIYSFTPTLYLRCTTLCVYTEHALLRIFSTLRQRKAI